MNLGDITLFIFGGGVLSIILGIQGIVLAGQKWCGWLIILGITMLFVFMGMAAYLTIPAAYS